MSAHYILMKQELVLVSSLSYIGARIVVQYTAAAAHRIGRARHMKKEREAVSLSVRPQHLTPETRSLRLAVPQIVLLLPLSLFSLFSLHLDTKRDKKKKEEWRLSLSLSILSYDALFTVSYYYESTTTMARSSSSKTVWWCIGPLGQKKKKRKKSKCAGHSVSNLFCVL